MVSVQLAPQTDVPQHCDCKCCRIVYLIELFDKPCVLQNDKSQADLVDKLTEACRESPESQQRLFSLYDGTDVSSSNPPDTALLQGAHPGKHCISLYYDTNYPTFLGVLKYAL